VESDRRAPRVSRGLLARMASRGHKVFKGMSGEMGLGESKGFKVRRVCREMMVRMVRKVSRAVLVEMGFRGLKVTWDFRERLVRRVFKVSGDGKAYRVRKD